MNNPTNLMERPRARRGQLSPIQIDKCASKGLFAQIVPRTDHFMKLRFSTVVTATQTTPKALRKMLQNETLVLPRPPQDGWTDFSLMQLATLTIARRQIEFGMSVHSASRFACAIVIERAVMSLLGKPSVSAKNFVDAFSTTYALILMNGGEPKLSFFQSERWPEFTGTKCAVLAFPIGPIVRRAFELAEIPDDTLVPDILADLIGFWEVSKDVPETSTKISALITKLVRGKRPGNLQPEVLKGIAGDLASVRQTANAPKTKAAKTIKKVGR